jgi:hypothetical protein
MKLVYILAAALLFITSACTLEQHVHFNKDWSGSITYKIDMSGMQALMGDSAGGEGSQSMLSDPAVQTSIDEMRDMEGISNVRIDEDTVNGIYTIGFDFANLERLNEGMAGANLTERAGNPAAKTGADQSDHQYFVLKGKKLIFQMPTPAPSEEEEAATEDMGEMGEMMRYNLKITVDKDKEIKKIKASNDAKVIEYGRGVELDVSLTKLTDPEFKSKIEMTVKDR